MKFIDFVYVMCCSLYRKKEENMFKISGLLLLVAALEMNLILLVFFYSDFGDTLNHDIVLNTAKYAVYASILFILPALYLRYFKFYTYEDIRYDLHQMKNRTRNVYGTFYFLYIILSFLSTISYAIYNGGIISGFW